MDSQFEQNSGSSVCGMKLNSSLSAIISDADSCDDVDATCIAESQTL